MEMKYSDICWIDWVPHFVSATKSSIRLMIRLTMRSIF